jgi:hypothetical protein
MPKHLRDLQAEGWTPDMLKNARAFFSQHGIDIGYSTRRRSWFAIKLGSFTPGCVVVCCWMGLGAFVDYLDAPSTLVGAMKDCAATAEGGAA